LGIEQRVEGWGEALSSGEKGHSENRTRLRKNGRAEESEYEGIARWEGKDMKEKRSLDTKSFSPKKFVVLVKKRRRGRIFSEDGPADIVHERFIGINHLRS